MSKISAILTPNFRRVAGSVAAALGSMFFVFAVVIWFQDEIIVKPFGHRIKLVEPNAWWIGTALWMGALLLWPEAPRFASRLAAALGRAAGRLGVDLVTTAGRYTAAGVVAGGVAGFFFTLEYYYLAPQLGLRLLVLLAAAVTSGLVHRGFALAHVALTARLNPGKPWMNAAGRLSLYLLVWSLLIIYPLRSWEARGTEPMVVPGVLAAACGLVMAWLLLAPWRLPGAVGRARRAGVLMAAGLAVAASLYSFAHERKLDHPASPVRQRVLLVTMDTTRADYLSCYGYGRQTSPNLDRLASQGVRFTHFFCDVGTTDPSHATILTGDYPRTHGLNNNHQSVTGKVPSVAEFFYDRGFTTGAVVSREHVLPENLNIPGFADMHGVKVWQVSTSAREAWRRAANYILQNRDRDIFVWVHFFDPHGPYDPHPGISDAFYGKDRGSRGGRRLLKPGQTYSDKEIKYRRDLYAGEIFYMDRYLGKLFDLMDHLEPRAERPPLILVTADHGEFLGEYINHPARIGFGHGPIFNPGIYVPLIVKYQGFIPAGKLVNEVAESVDIAPTLLDYAFDFHSYPGQGQSLRPLIEGSGRGDQLAFIRGEGGAYSRYSPLYAVIDNNFKLMISVDADGELFDLNNDWHEKHDLRAQRSDMAAELTYQFRMWEARTPETQVRERDLTPAEKKTLRALGYID